MRTTARRTTGAVGAAVAVLAVAACSGDAPGQAATTTVTATVTASPTASPTTSPAASPTTVAPEPTAGLEGFTAPGTELTAEPADGRLTVVAVRTGEHDGYDRVVYELAGEGLPGWRVGYVDQAVDDPSDEVVAVDGDAILRVWLTGTSYPFETGHEEFAQDVRPDDGDVEHVTRPLTFEGRSQSFVGVDDGPRPFRVFLLQDPVRVVVDVQDEG
ncbi:hypothetical protein GC089_12775 [Cellulomonas sp. JZ18]|uniref:AMIN-like domain-containing (lipo)protein n=1 Tax=Cellulomonas sp. JZ18 TaxID=2654191 RepID=UPI0012D47BAA|nr:hypothetical protein [Cellulomonas sp. JZ18]QGQ19930.1 hypothetical protein GC089_12775 [Cellulomonas sp. JZ18]